MYHISSKLGKERRKRRKESWAKKRRERRKKRPTGNEWGVNASLRFAFTSKVKRGAFYNRKEVRKESKGGSHNRKGSFIKRVFVYYQKGLIKERCQIKERSFVYQRCLYQRKGVHEKRKRGKRKTKRKPK